MEGLVHTNGEMTPAADLAPAPALAKVRMLLQMAEALDDEAAMLFRRAGGFEEEESLLNRELEELQTEISRLLLKLSGLRAERDGLFERVDALRLEADSLRDEAMQQEGGPAPEHRATPAASASGFDQEGWSDPRVTAVADQPPQAPVFFNRMVLP